MAKNNRFIGKRIGSRACSKRTFRLVPRSVFDQVRKFELGVEMRRIRHFAIRKCKLAYDLMEHHQALDKIYRLMSKNRILQGFFLITGTGWVMVRGCLKSRFTYK